MEVRVSGDPVALTEDEQRLRDALDMLIDRKNEADEMYGDEVHGELHKLHCAEANFAYEVMNAWHEEQEAARTA
jgi:hypothetical protein